MSRSGEIVAGRGPALLIALGALLLCAAPAAAQDPAAGLAEAEQRVAAAETEVPALEAQVTSAEARYRSAARSAAPSLQALRRAKAEARRVRRRLAARERAARARISQLEGQRRQEADDRDETVRSGVGFGLAALVGGIIAIGWGWFRASAPVAALSEIDLGRAVGLCVGGGFLLVIVGLVLGGSNGVVGALGSFLACLGLILPAAFLLARHSAEVQRGRAKPLLGRDRLPSWVPLATAGAMLVLFLAGTGSALFAEGASSEPVSPQLEARAQAGSSGSGARRLSGAKAAVARAHEQAAAPLARRNAARRKLAVARRELGHAQDRLASARRSERSFGSQLVALEAKERRQLQKQEERLAREEAKRVEEEEQTASEASECDPNYSGCLDPNASDYDCEGGSGDGPLYTGTVEVLGVDHYGLDSDGDGIGCEAG